MAIEQFRGEHHYLSNMYPLDNFIPTPQGVWVPTSEHAYMASRFHDQEAALKVLETKDGKQAKSTAYELIGKGAEVITGWHQRKFRIMVGVVTDKFDYNPELAEKLVATGDEELIEGNTWNDRYWGVSPPGSQRGKNRLGEVLTIVRANLAVARPVNQSD